MLDILAIALFQAAAGDPTAPPPAAETPAEAPAVAAETQTAEEQAADERRRCRIRRTTGSRLSSVVTCRNQARSGYQDYDTNQTMNDFQQPPALPQ